MPSRSPATEEVAAGPGRLIGQLLSAALIAGLLASLALSIFQAIWVWPIIREAETFEVRPAVSAEAGHQHGGSHAAATGHEHGGVEIGPSAFTSIIANALLGVGCALVVGACLVARARDGWREGLLLGIAGWVAFSLSPALGLPPELPGADAADLQARQIWWIVTVACTAGGLAFLLLIGRSWATVAGLVLLVLPHLIGAPQGEGHGTAPVELEREFQRLVLVTSFAFWAMLGSLTGVALARLSSTASARRPAMA